MISGSTAATFHSGLPLVKPPYGQMTAINLNKGEIAWRVPFGDDERVRNHPALQGVTLPERLGVAGAPGAIVTKGGLVFAGGGDRAIHALDKSNGSELWSHRFTAPTSATPMTYRAANGKQYVVIATGSGKTAALIAFALTE
jgi:quinoprotein glucose dehydrogenase